MKKRKNNDSVRAIIYLVTYFCCRFTFVLLNELVNKETQFTFKCLVHLAKIGTYSYIVLAGFGFN